MTEQFPPKELMAVAALASALLEERGASLNVVFPKGQHALEWAASGGCTIMGHAYGFLCAAVGAAATAGMTKEQFERMCKDAALLFASRLKDRHAQTTT